MFDAPGRSLRRRPADARSGTQAVRAASLSLAIAAFLATSSGAAQEPPGSMWRVGPFVNARAADTGQSISLGIEARPTPLSAIGGRLAAIVRKARPDEPQAEVSNDRYAFGVSLQLLSEFGRGKPEGRAAPATADVSVLGVGLGTSWFFANYPYQPYRQAPQSTFGYSFNVELRGWWFTTVGSPAATGTPAAGTLLSGTRPPAPAVNHRAWLAEPQIRLSYGRQVREADDSHVVFPPLANGLQLAYRAKLAPPSDIPAASVLLAMPISPPSGRFAFGPSLRFTAWGPADTWALWSSPGSGPVSGRGRLELWLYYFAWSNDNPAIRVGVAPFLDTHLYGVPIRDNLVGGLALELRASTSRLEY